MITVLTKPERKEELLQRTRLYSSEIEIKTREDYPEFNDCDDESSRVKIITESNSGPETHYYLLHHGDIFGENDESDPGLVKKTDNAIVYTFHHNEPEDVVYQTLFEDMFTEESIRKLKKLLDDA